jgi:hypothetical protein
VTTLAWAPVAAAARAPAAPAVAAAAAAARVPKAVKRRKTSQRSRLENACVEAGRRNLNLLTHSLKATWFQTRTLEYVKCQSWFQNVPFKFNLYRCIEAITVGRCTLNQVD